MNKNERKNMNNKDRSEIDRKKVYAYARLLKSGNWYVIRELQQAYMADNPFLSTCRFNKNLFAALETAGMRYHIERKRISGKQEKCLFILE
jgi:hypothetical protein